MPEQPSSHHLHLNDFPEVRDALNRLVTAVFESATDYGNDNSLPINTAVALSKGLMFEVKLEIEKLIDAAPPQSKLGAGTMHYRKSNGNNDKDNQSSLN